MQEKKNTPCNLRNFNYLIITLLFFLFICRANVKDMLAIYYKVQKKCTSRNPIIYKSLIVV